MAEQLIMWAGLAFLLLFCLPIPFIQRTILALSSWAVRLGLFALIAGAAYLWFRPNELPSQAREILNWAPWLRSMLPEAGTMWFGVCAAALCVAVLAPVLAVLDCARNRGRLLVKREVREIASAPPPAPVQVVVPARVGRRAAADVLATSGRRF
jgi:hypothetical protein